MTKEKRAFWALFGWVFSAAGLVATIPFAFVDPPYWWPEAVPTFVPGLCFTAALFGFAHMTRRVSDELSGRAR